MPLHRLRLRPPSSSPVLLRIYGRQVRWSNKTRPFSTSNLASRNPKEDSSFEDVDGGGNSNAFFDSNNDYDYDGDGDGDDDDDDDDYIIDRDEAASFQPWKTLLEAPARAAWRATDPQRDPPGYLKNAMYHILDEGDRTSKQLKRAHRKVQSIQSSLADLRERERRIMVNGKGHFKQQQQQQDDRDHHLSDTTDNNRGRRENNMDDSNNYNSSSSSSSSSFRPVYYGFDETLATLKHRLEPNYAITKRVLMECQSLLGGKRINAPSSSDSGNESNNSSERGGQQLYSNNWKPKRILDFGIGCGSASAAAIDLFGSGDNNSSASSSSSAIEWIHGIDPSQTMRECSKKLIEEMTKGHHNNRVTNTTTPTPPPPPRITFSNSLTTSSSSSDDSSSSSSPGGGGGSFDLALFVYTASDLPDVTSCLAAAAMSFEKLKPDGVFVMIEPGTPDGFNSIRAVRNMLLDCCPPHDPDFEWEDRCHIVAPCTHNGTCPMERHKKNFFMRKKPIGKLGHDLPQEMQEEDDDDDDVEYDHHNDDYHDHDPEESDDDYGQDYVELSSPHNNLMSETEAFNSSFCSFVHNVSGDSRKKGEKFSYLVAQKQRFRQPVVDGNSSFDNVNGSVDPSTKGDPFRRDNVTDLLTDALDAASLRADDLAHRTFEKARELNSRYIESENDDLGLELLQGEDKRRSMGRIIRAPIKKKGHVYIDYCAAPGRIIRSRVTKALSNSVAPGIYGAARKSRWGGLWPDTMDKIFSKQTKK